MLFGVCNLKERHSNFSVKAFCYVHSHLFYFLFSAPHEYRHAAVSCYLLKTLAFL